MDVGEHPHIGLQTVTWLIEGEVLHRDNLGSDQLIRPGQLNWMTSGRGIAHAEHGKANRNHVVQMWVALPDADRNCEPSFDHHAELPRHLGDGWIATLLGGEAFGHVSPARAFSPLLGMELLFTKDATATVPLNAAFEHGGFVIEGGASIGGEKLVRDELVYLGTKREEIGIFGKAGTRFMLLGGAPFGEAIVMWWNFVARSEEEIAAAREQWQQKKFPAIPQYVGPWIDAPPLRPR